MASGLLVTQKGLDNMATRALIGMQVENGIKTMYCHWDGHVTSAGLTLATAYQDRTKVEKLMELGNISSLDSEPVIVARHQDAAGCTRAGEYEAACLLAGAGLADLWDEAGQEYEYLYTLEGTWLVRLSDRGRAVGSWYILELVDGTRTKMGALYQAEDPKPAKVRKAPKKAAPVAQADPFAEALAAFQALPASKQAKVLPALKALLEMAEG